MISNLLKDKDVPFGCDSLANTTILAALNVLLLLLVVISTIFKLLRIIKRHRTQGLAFGYLFLGVPFCISQLCIAITSSIEIFPGIECCPAAASLGLSAFNPMLLLLSALVVVTGSLILFVLASKYGPNEHPHNCERENLEDCSRTSQHATIGTYTQSACSAVIALYILAFLFPTILSLIITTAYADADAIFYFYLKYALDFHLTLLPILTIGQFIPQVVLLWRERHNLDKLPLDIPAFVLDMIVFVLIGVSWRQLMLHTYPAVVNLWYGISYPLSWQQWGSCIWFDYVLFGLGQGFVAVLYLYLRSRNHDQPKPVDRKADLEEGASEQASEITPLL